MRTIILGLDAFDPNAFEQMLEQGRLPRLRKFVENGGYSRFRVSNPAQSEVSWTSIATGSHPGDHGMFDFVHRDPGTYSLSVSLLPTKRSITGTKFTSPHSSHTVFDEAAERGYPATSLWWPATFPARLASPVNTVPGLGTPDIRGRLGVGTVYTSNGARGNPEKTPVEKLKNAGRGRYEGHFLGPAQQTKGPAEAAFVLDMEREPASLTVGDRSVDLMEGVWSPIIELRFRLGFRTSVAAITRVILTHGGDAPQLYVLPLQLHPLKPLWSYGSPHGFIKETWQWGGPFLTLGWPQDTTALQEELITDAQFLTLCENIFRNRRHIFLHHLKQFTEGLLGGVFDSLDRVQHMFWRDHPDIVAGWYEKLDEFVGEVEDELNTKSETRLVILSDHGFGAFHHKVHLNRWLIDEGYLHFRGAHTSGEFSEIDWPQTRAYAIGLNSIYLNLRGRERDGIVPAESAKTLRGELSDNLLRWSGPTGEQVVVDVQDRDQVPDGPMSSYGPDLLIGYSPGFRASAETGMGGWREPTIEPNNDHWGADHCFSPAAVSGVLFANATLSSSPEPSYLDVPELSGVPIQGGRTATREPARNDEDMAEVEERLRSLGYF